MEVLWPILFSHFFPLITFLHYANYILPTLYCQSFIIIDIDLAESGDKGKIHEER